MSKSSQRFPVIRRLWKPLAIGGAGGTATLLWFEEILLFGEEILALIFLPLMAGILYILDNFIFKANMPKREDFNTGKGAKK